MQYFLGLNAENKVQETAVSPFYTEQTVATAAVTASPADAKMVATDSEGKVILADKNSEVTACLAYITEEAAGGATVKVYTSGEIAGTGLTPNAPVYLTASGGFSTTAPTAATGEILQEVGRAITATLWKFEPQPYIIRA